MAAKRRGATPEQKPGAELTSTYNNLLTLDGQQKGYCGACGLPRDPEYAKTHPCGACGALGTQPKPPQFDDDGERIEPAPKPAKAEPKTPKTTPQTREQQAAHARAATAALFRAALRGGTS